MMNPKTKVLKQFTDINRLLSWFIILRWIACFGVFIALLTVFFSLKYDIPFLNLYILNSILFLLNLFFTVYFFVLKKKILSRQEMNVLFHVQVICDYILLFLLIFFTGYLENPFIYFFVFHIMLTAFIFSRRVVIFYLSVLLVAFISVTFAEYFSLLPHFGLYPVSQQAYHDLTPVRAFGLISTLVITGYLSTSIKSRIEQRGKSVEVELNRYKSLDKIKSNFILQVTHEIRGPIAALKGFIEMVLKRITGEIPDKTDEILRKANRRIDNLLTIIDEMIDYAYMKSEEDAKYISQEINLREIIDYNIDLFTARARDRKMKFSVNCYNDIVLTSNRDLLNIILGNLISNSIKYSREGGTISIIAEQKNAMVHITVQDEGIGILPEEMDKIFEEFYRTQRARKIERDGTGLGLSIIKRAVEALGGSISVYSEQDRGTSFHIYHPCKRGEVESNID
ncbi:MAG: HAMP domain-containing histidine kinase [Spirochaetales bacterium]|nr:HAMP domain-containing histidine kinase [Spirochaetales bacterium]